MAGSCGSRGIAFFFSSGGVPSPPYPGPTGVYPPPPQGRRAIRDNTGKSTDTTIHDGNSTRTTGSGHAEKGAGSGQGEEGGDTYPPSLLFSKWGVPPPHVAERVGGEEA